MQIIDGQFSITPHLPAKTLMMSPEWVRMGVEQYFNSPSILTFIKFIEEIDIVEGRSKAKRDQLALLVECMKMPTPEEYARHMGFSNFNTMKKVMENPDYSEASRHYLLVGCSILADMLTRAGLDSKLDSKFTKYVMSAYLAINEKTETYTQSDNKVHIEWGASPIAPLVHNQPVPIDMKQDPQLIELNHDPFEIALDKLERALPPSMQLPAYRTDQAQDNDN